jgi:hypothetical protein
MLSHFGRRQPAGAAHEIRMTADRPPAAPGFGPSGAMPDTAVTVNGKPLRFGNRQDGFVFRGAVAGTRDCSLTLAHGGDTAEA